MTHAIPRFAWAPIPLLNDTTPTSTPVKGLFPVRNHNPLHFCIAIAAEILHTLSN